MFNNIVDLFNPIHFINVFKDPILYQKIVKAVDNIFKTIAQLFFGIPSHPPEKPSNVIFVPPSRDQKQIEKLFQENVGEGTRNPFTEGYFESLPVEIFHEVIKLLNVREFTDLKLTSKAAYSMKIPKQLAQVIVDNPRPWERDDLAVGRRHSG